VVIIIIIFTGKEALLYVISISSVGALGLPIIRSINLLTKQRVTEQGHLVCEEGGGGGQVRGQAYLLSRGEYNWALCNTWESNKCTWFLLPRERDANFRSFPLVLPSISARRPCIEWCPYSTVMGEAALAFDITALSSFWGCRSTKFLKNETIF
jgi:hypothetical protein